jgi:hypothetical protein
MNRKLYRNYIIDVDDLGRQYIYNTISPYSENSDKKVVGMYLKESDIKKIIDDEIERRGHYEQAARNNLYV